MSNTNTDNSPPQQKPYTGPVKRVWVDGRQILQPNLEGQLITKVHEFRYQKTLDETISEADICKA